MFNYRIERFVCGICLSVLFAFMLSIFVHLFEDQFLTEESYDYVANKRISIDWESLYPFENPSSVTFFQEKKFLENNIKSLKLHKAKIKEYTSEKLTGYYKLVELAKKYEKLVQWNFVGYNQYNGVFKLKDDYLTRITKEKDVRQSANSIIDFAQFCKKHNVKFIYIQTPFKICKYEDKNVTGFLDYSNQNADRFLGLLHQSNVDTFDFREIIHKEGLEHHQLFYKTDHHWRVETGLYAARHILHLLKSKYNVNTEETVLDEQRFRKVDYPALFLGSHGKKVTLAIAEPEDFSLLYPLYPTKIHYEIPDMGIDKTGDFSIMFDMSQVDKADYYKKFPYAACNYGDHPLVRIENKLVSNKNKILIIQDSFADCVLPFLAMGIKFIDAIDLRFFTGSLVSYIKNERPNFVIVLYNNSYLNFKF